MVGEKVLVKAVQDPSQSVKWTAQRVQVLNGQVSSQSILVLFASNFPLDHKHQSKLFFFLSVFLDKPFKSPPPLLHSTTPNLMPSILGNKRQPLLKSPKIPPLIPGMQPNPGKLQQCSTETATLYRSCVQVISKQVAMYTLIFFQVACSRFPIIKSCHGLLTGVVEAERGTMRSWLAGEAGTGAW